jgi:hypothetical protein
MGMIKEDKQQEVSKEELEEKNEKMADGVYTISQAMKQLAVVYGQPNDAGNGVPPGPVFDMAALALERVLSFNACSLTRDLERPVRADLTTDS